MASENTVAVDGEKGSHDQETENENVPFASSFDKLSLGPKKKLLVLCLGGLLVHRAKKRDKHAIPGHRPDFSYGQFHVYARPYYLEFLKFCFERFEVALWTSAKERNVDAVLKKLMGEIRSKFLFVWDQTQCTMTGFKCLEDYKKPIFFKELRLVWEKVVGEFSSSDTLLIDNDPYKGLLNPPNTAIFPVPYNPDDLTDNFLSPGGVLCTFLDGVAEAKDVPSYVEANPFGLPAVRASDPDWAYYSLILNKLEAGEAN